MIHIQERVLIHQPVERVFEYVTDPGNNAVWQSGILETAITSEGSLAIGSTYRCVNRFLGMRFESAGEIVEYEPNRICTYRFTSGSVSGETRFTFKPQSAWYTEPWNQRRARLNPKCALTSIPR